MWRMLLSRGLALARFEERSVTVALSLSNELGAIEESSSPADIAPNCWNLQALATFPVITTSHFRKRLSALVAGSFSSIVNNSCGRPEDIIDLKQVIKLPAIAIRSRDRQSRAMIRQSLRSGRALDCGDL